MTKEGSDRGHVDAPVDQLGGDGVAQAAGSEIARRLDMAMVVLRREALRGPYSLGYCGEPPVEGHSVGLARLVRDLEEGDRAGLPLIAN